MRQAGVNQLVVRRLLPAAVRSELERAAEQPAHRREVEVPAGGQLDADALVSWLPAGPGRDWLARDLARWSSRFTALTDGRAALAGLSVIDDDKCRKFHVDFVALRMLITYAGPGTELVPDEAVVRAALEEPAHCATEANAAIVSAPGLVQHASAGDVVLLKGERWPGNAGRGVVHRSPPLRERSLRRLLFVLTDHGPGGRPR